VLLPVQPVLLLAQLVLPLAQLQRPLVQALQQVQLLVLSQQQHW
jgi:hypothetical protein